MSDPFEDHLGETFDIDGKKYRLGKFVNGDSSCFFCGDPGPCRFLHWTAMLMLNGVVTAPRFFPQCRACHDRPKHVLDAIIACGGKMAD